MEGKRKDDTTHEGPTSERPFTTDSDEIPPQASTSKTGPPEREVSSRGHWITHSSFSGQGTGSYYEGPVTFINQGEVSSCGHSIIHSSFSGQGAGSYYEGPVTIINQGNDASSVQKDAEKESERYLAICRKVENYVRTDMCKQALNELDKNNALLLLAGAGDGKSTLLKQLALELEKSHFLTIRINSPEDIKNYDITGKKVLFVCDNLLGETVIDEDKAKVWKNSVREDFDTSGEDVKFVFACRLDLWGRRKADLQCKNIFQNTADVSSPKLSYDDKLNMLKQYLHGKISVKVMEYIAKKSTLSFPECCRLVSERCDGIDFSNTEQLVKLFLHPFKFVVKQLKTVQTNHKDQYAALVLCLLNDRRLPRINPNRALEGPKFREIFQNVCPPEQSLDKLLDAADQLNGSLLTEEGDSYDFYHDSICEAMGRVHGERYPGDILTYCKPEVVFSVFQVCGSDPDRVTLTPCSYEKLLEIVTRECVKERLMAYSETGRFVFEELKGADILEQWYKHLLKSHPAVGQETVASLRLFDCLQFMTQLPRSLLTIDDCFEAAAYHGEIETSRLLIDSGVTRDGRGDALMWAAQRGHSEIVRLIVEEGDLDIEGIGKGLLEAVLSDRVECVRAIMRLRPPINIYTIHSALQWAVTCNRVECLCEMLKRDIDKDTINTLLEWAVKSGRVHCVREFLQHSPISRWKVQTLLDKPDRELFNPLTPQTDRDKTRRQLHTYLDTLTSTVDRGVVELCRAAGEGQVETLTHILQQTHLNREDMELGLKRAVFCNRAESVKVFMMLELNIDTIHSLLQEALEWNSVECLCEMLKRDIDTHTIHRLLKWAVWNYRPQCVRELLKYPSISRRKIKTLLDELDRELFRCSERQTDRDDIRRLLHKYLDSLTSDVDKRAVELWRAAGEGQVETLIHILQQADLDREDIEIGLKRAVVCNRVESVKVFLTLDLNADTIKSLLEWAVQCNSVDCLCEFLKRDADTYNTQYTIHSLLQKAVEYNSVDCLCEILKRDIDMDTVRSLLEEAVEHNRVECLCEILKRGIDTGTIHKLLEVAMGCNRVQCVRELLKHPSISKRKVQTLSNKHDRELFRSSTPQTDRDEIRRLVHTYLD